MLTTAALLFLVGFVPSRSPLLDSIKLDSDRYREAVTMLAPNGLTTKNYPAEGTPQVRRWTASDRSIQYTVYAVLPGLTGQTQATAESTLQKQAADLHTEFGRDGGQTIEINRGGFGVRLTMGYSVNGDLRLVESSVHPVYYYRAMVAKAEDAPGALAYLIGLGMWTGGDRVAIYNGEIPKGWSLPLGGDRIAIPYPKDPETLEGTTGKIRVTPFWGEDSRWYHEDHYGTTEEPPSVWAARPHPRLAKSEVEPKVTSAGIVTYLDRKLVRVGGTIGRGEFTEEWVAWYDRDDVGKITSILAIRKPGKPWPAGLPLDPARTGTPIADDAWVEPKAKKPRTVTRGPGASVTFTAWGRPVQGQIGINYLENQPYEETSLLYEKGADDLLARFDPRKAWIPETFKGKDAMVDMTVCERPGGTWVLVRTMSFNNQEMGPRIRRFELIHTVQGGVPFLLYLKGLDNNSFRDGFKAIVQSFKTADGTAPFADYPQAGGKVQWYLPYHQLKFNLNMNSPIAANYADNRSPLLGGWTLSDSKTQVMFSNHPNVPVTNPMHDVFGNAVGWKRKGKPKSWGMVAFGQDARVTEAEWEREGGARTILTSVSHRPGAATHFARPKGTPDQAWKEFVEKNR